MGQKITLLLLLTFSVFAVVNANPIAYTALGTSQIQQTQDKKKEPTPAQAQIVIQESTEHPEFIKLADGRIVPYGPGVVCQDICVKENVADYIITKSLKPYVITGTIALGATAAYFAFREGAPEVHTNPNPGPGGEKPPTVDVAESQTLILLLLGLSPMLVMGLRRYRSSF